jgi:hypothetical protein
VPIPIASYRSVFDLERRIYRVDRLRLNPSGVPLRGVLYFLVFLLAALLARTLPLLGVVLGVLPWYACDLALPVGGAVLLGAIRIDGRPAHLAAWALLRYACAPARLIAGRPAHTRSCSWCPHELVVWR